jgi:hypothetical protein
MRALRNPQREAQRDLLSNHFRTFETSIALSGFLGNEDRTMHANRGALGAAFSTGADRPLDERRRGRRGGQAVRVSSTTRVSTVTGSV